MILIIAITVLSLDQLTKFLINGNLLQGESIPVIKNIFHLTLVYNRGAAFGIFRNQVPLFILASVFAVAMICFNLKGHKYGKVYNAALSLILGGALGNLIDRIIFGHVIDFLDFRIWPVFNLADSAITVGAVLLGLQMLTCKSHKVTKSQSHL